MAEFKFELLAEDGPARRGRLHTPHGVIDTPAFMPVGTAATVKAMMTDQVAQTGAQVILGNTYHLMLRPGPERMAKLGGLHKFMNWSGPILTDSGGFQVMSLAGLRKISETGVTFSSHIDGTRYELTPERSMEIQSLLGSDIQMVFDECTPYPADHETARKSMELSMRWAARSRVAFDSHTDGGATGQAAFGIIQGGIYEDLRRESLAALMDIGFHGVAVGGLAVGEGQEMMFAVLDGIGPHLPRDLPHYLMGVGKPDDIIGAVGRGIDMFDCVVPTRSGRHGQAFTWDGQINLKNASFAEDLSPLDPESDCPASSLYSKAYLHHLVKSGEMLGAMLLTWHNVSFYQRVMSRLRVGIEQGTFAETSQNLLLRASRSH